jgi:hypothetical protein
MQMGVVYDRLLEPVNAPLEAVGTRGAVRGGWRGWGGWGGWVDPFSPVQRCDQRGLPAAQGRRLGQPGFRARQSPRGHIVIMNEGSAERILQDLAQAKGLRFEAATAPISPNRRAPPVRVGLWDTYGGSMPVQAGSGGCSNRWRFRSRWCTRPRLDGGNLGSKYDVLIFPDGAIRPRIRPRRLAGQRVLRPDADAGGDSRRVPRAAGRGRRWEKTVPQIRAFVEAGGKVITIGSSALNLAGTSISASPVT